MFSPVDMQAIVISLIGWLFCSDSGKTINQLNEPRHDKTNKMAVRQAKPGSFSYPLSAQWRLWSDWADAQADLSLRWAHTHFVGFVMSRLKCCHCSVLT